uniref:Ppx/GppA phosphatase n=1 Tax=Chlorobium chlorochromatii (strain CaD3) TaxID=340177 RepID=Q3AP08_CHLCH
MTHRVACIDIGTNTALLLIADLNPTNGTIHPLCHRQTIVRLGKNVDAHKVIDSAAQTRLMACMQQYRQLADEHGCSSIVAAGTSALRDAVNRDEVVQAVENASGITITPIAGESEAALTFMGAVAGVQEVPERFVVIDIGGGSTEISIGSMQGIEHGISLNIGSVRLTERFFSSLPPSEEEFEAAKLYITMHLTTKLFPFFAGREAVYGVAGTVTTIAQVTQGMRHFDAERVQHYPLQYQEVRNFLEKLKSSSLEEIIAHGIPDGRADVITMGTLILHQFMRLLGAAEVRTSIQGLRFGLAQQELVRLQMKA